MANAQAWADRQRLLDLIQRALQKVYTETWGEALGAV